MTRWVRALWLAIGAAVLLRLFLLAWLPLTDPAEGRYGEIGRKMAELGDWITPWHQYGVPFWGKPPLSFWMTALSLKGLGINEFAARLPHFLAGVATAACLWNVARARAAHEGVIAAGVLGTALLFFLSSGAVMTDAGLVLGTTLATTGAWLALSSEDPVQRRRQAWLAFVGGALGILAKGPLALVLVGTPLLLWAAWCGRWRALWEALPWVRGVVLMVALSAPWFFAAEWKTPGFFEYFFVGEHYHRFATPGWAGDLYGKAHQEPKGMIWVFAAGACMPWTVVLPALVLWRWWRARGGAGVGAETVAAADGASAQAVQASSQRGSPSMGLPPSSHGPWALSERETARFIRLCALVPLVFFTASSNIIWTYVLPAMPGLAWWAARWLGRLREQGLRWASAGVWLAVLAWTALAFITQANGRLERSSAKGLVAACDAAWARHAPGADATMKSSAGQAADHRDDAAAPATAGDGATQGAARLVLLGRRSFSAHFYTQGRALRVDHLHEAQTQWPASGTCLAVKQDDPASLAAARDGAQLVEDLGVHHERQLWWALRLPGLKDKR
ncbi:MAG: glycosyltransferase family 39 protein [Betaproteobacteria bacterium]|nr:glycosyltransferase family 39 protein [Betaproteobacteria bacterium]